MKTNVQDLLEDAAPRPTAALDVDQVERRAQALRRRRTAGRALSGVGAVALLTLAVANLGGGQPTRLDTVDPAGPGSTARSEATTTTVVTGGAQADPESGHSAPSTSTTAATSKGSIPAQQGAMFDDPAGDTEKTNMWAPGTIRSPEPELDVVRGRIAALPDDLLVQVRVADLTDSPPPGADGGAYKVAFTFETGGATTGGRVSMQRYDGFEEIQIAIGTERFSPCPECSVQFDSDGDTVSGLVSIAVINRHLRASGHPGPGLRSGDRVFDPTIDTQWVHTENQNQETDGPYAASTADRATGPGRSVTFE